MDFEYKDEDNMMEPQEEPKPEPQEEPEVEQEVISNTGYSYDYNYSYRYDQPHQPTEDVPKKSESKHTSKWILCISMAIVFGLLASLVFQVSNRVMDGLWPQEGNGKTPLTTTQIADNAESVNSDIATVAKNVMPSVVSITNLSVQEVQYFFFGEPTVQETKSSGSGIVIGQNDTELLIVTNNHVVAGSNTLTVTFADETSVEAQIKGTDADIDIAVIAVPLSGVSEETKDSIKIATLGDSDSLSVGEPAIAIGNALGYGQSVTSGIISALEREMDDFDTKLIQTDAAINPGNSGGPLLNARGEVIGINTVKVSADAVESMGYAIPISDVNDIINELMNRETRNKVKEGERGAIGIQGISVGEEYSKLYGIPQGVQIAEIIEGGAAQKAGLPKRGIITKFDGTRIASMEELQEQLEYYKSGETVKIVVEVVDETGEYSPKTYEVTLGKQVSQN